MKAERLLALYEKVAEAPDAIARLRRFVLDLAVRGKLVSQDPADEPASKLLKRIATEKARFVKAGWLKAERSPKEPSASVELFELPYGWAWTNLQSICLSISDGDHQPPPKAEIGVPFLVIGDVRTKKINYDAERKVSQEYFDGLDPIRKPRPGDLLYTLVGSFGIPIPVQSDTPFCIQRHIGILRPTKQVELHALAFFLESEFAFKQAEAAATGIAQKTVSLAGLRAVMLPLPPLAEQRRIVAKVEELMALLDRLEAARQQREATREQLTAASLARLTAHDTDAEAFPTHARFALDAFPALTARPDQIKSLRQTILNLAVRGKLVAQDPANNPLPQFDKGMPSDLEVPFDLPRGWQWSRLSSLGTLKGGGTPSKARDDFWNGSIPWVSPKDMKVDYIDAAQLNITDSAITGSAVSLIESESVLFVVRGMILAHSFPTAISKVPLTINQDMKAIILKKPEMAEYILRALKGLTPEMLARVKRSSHGTCRIEGSDYSEFLIPLPPLAEQHRIVAKVDALMALCDRLEAALDSADTTRARLLEALLHEALVPGTEAVKEAAE